MSFGSELENFKETALDATEKTRKGIIFELFKSVILDTPVDTGRARGNWQTSVGTPKTNEVDRTDASGGQSVGEVLDNLGGPDDTVFLSNNLPYAERLENGYSGQAPEGMVRKNVARIKRVVEKEARKHRK